MNRSSFLKSLFGAPLAASAFIKSAEAAKNPFVQPVENVPPVDTNPKPHSEWHSDPVWGNCPPSENVWLMSGYCILHGSGYY